MSESGDRTDDADALRLRLKLIEDLRLEERAEAFSEVHSQLQSLLEGGDAARGDGHSDNRGEGRNHG